MSKKKGGIDMFVSVKSLTALIDQDIQYYIDDGFLLGWYYSTDGAYIGDGTLETAERIERERQE
jgi:hypothetical protein